MASRKQEKRARSRRAIEAPFAALPIRMMEHDAFRTLPYFDRAVLLALAGEYRGADRPNNGGIALTYAQARDRYGIRGKNRFYQALEELEWRGLIRRTWAGRLRQYSDAGPSRFLLEWLYIDELPQYGVMEGPATNNWQSWTPDRPRHPRKEPRKKKPVPAGGDGKPSTVPADGDGNASTVPARGDGNPESPYPPVGTLLKISPGGSDVRLQDSSARVRKKALSGAARQSIGENR